MATTDYEDPPEPTGLAAAQLWWAGKVADVTDTGPGLSLRIWLLILLIGLCCLPAPFPANVIGVGATIALAMSAPARIRRVK